MITKETIEKNRLNEEKIKSLLNPKTFGRVRKVEQPNLLPRRCAVTGRHTDRYFIDLGIDTGDFFGQVYICADIAENIARMAGWIPADEYREVVESNFELAAQALEILADYERIKKVLDGLNELDSADRSASNSKHLRELATKIASEADDRDSKKTSRSGTETDSRPDESSGQQGLANVSVFSGLKPPAI